MMMRREKWFQVNKIFLQGAAAMGAEGIIFADHTGAERTPFFALIVCILIALHHSITFGALPERMTPLDRKKGDKKEGNIVIHPDLFHFMVMASRAYPRLSG
jgi:hypothetical protein